MRAVHDIFTSRKHPGVKVSFIQHGTREQGFQYEVICPYCAKTVGWIDDHAGTMTNRELHSFLRKITGTHIRKCDHAGAATLAVEVTRVPLRTEERREL